MIDDTDAHIHTYVCEEGIRADGMPMADGDMRVDDGCEMAELGEGRSLAGSKDGLKVYYVKKDNKTENWYCLEIRSSSVQLKRLKNEVSYQLLVYNPGNHIYDLNDSSTGSIHLNYLISQFDSIYSEILTACTEILDKPSEEIDLNQRNLILKEAVAIVSSLSSKVSQIPHTLYLDLLDSLIMREKSSLSFEDLVGLFNQLKIEEISRVKVSPATLSYLNIVKEQLHPSLVKGKGKSKEGYSLFNKLSQLLSMASSRPVLRDILMHPINDLLALKERQARIEMFAKMPQYEKKQVELSLQHSNVLQSYMDMIDKGGLGINEWTKIAKWLGYLNRSLETVSGCASLRSPSLRVTFAHLPVVIGMITFVVGIIDTIVDPKCLDDVYLVKRGVSQVLDNLRNVQENFGDLLLEYERKQISETDLQSCDIEVQGIIFLPEIGYLTSCQPATGSDIDKNTSTANNEEQFVVDIYDLKSLTDYIEKQRLQDDWSFLFERSGKIFFKNSTTADLDDKFGNVRQEILIQQDTVLIELSQLIQMFSPVISAGIKTAIDIDIYMAMAKYMIQEQLTMPMFSRDSQIVIYKGEHVLTRFLLQNYTGEEYVTGNYFAGDMNPVQVEAIMKIQGDLQDRPDHLVDIARTNRVSYLFGPNGSGKSNFAKMVGIIVYSAYLGMPVACQSCVIGPIEQIYAFESKTDSVALSDGSFTSSLTEMMDKVMPTLDSHSLVILDEATKHANSICSATITKSISDILRAKFNGNYQGYCIVCSHDVDLLNKGTLLSDSFVSTLKMNYILKGENSIVYLFRPVLACRAKSLSEHATRQWLTCPTYLDYLLMYMRHAIPDTCEDLNADHSQVCQSLVVEIQKYISR